MVAAPIALAIIVTGVPAQADVAGRADNSTEGLAFTVISIGQEKEPSTLILYEPVIKAS